MQAQLKFDLVSKTISDFENDVAAMSCKRYANDKKMNEKYSGILLALALDDVCPQLMVGFPTESSKSETGADMVLLYSSTKSCCKKSSKREVQIVLAERLKGCNAHINRKRRMSSGKNTRGRPPSIKSAFKCIRHAVRNKINHCYADSGEMYLFCYSNFDSNFRSEPVVTFEKLLSKAFLKWFNKRGSFHSVFIWLGGHVYMCRPFGISKLAIDCSRQPFVDCKI